MDRMSARRPRWLAILAAATAVLLAYPQLQPAIASSALLVDAARSLAENVLGSGTITSLRSAHDGRELLIRWESPTYQEAKARVVNRELMYGEAVLATSAILGRLQEVVRIRFVIVKGGRMLATGENWRARGVSLAFGTVLGGGTYTPPPVPKSDHRKPAGTPSQEI